MYEIPYYLSFLLHFMTLQQTTSTSTIPRLYTMCPHNHYVYTKLENYPTPICHKLINMMLDTHYSTTVILCAAFLQHSKYTNIDDQSKPLLKLKKNMYLSLNEKILSKTATTFCVYRTNKCNTLMEQHDSPLLSYTYITNGQKVLLQESIYN